MSFRISKDSYQQIPKLIEFLEENSVKEIPNSSNSSFNLSSVNSEDKLIKEWGVSHTSLEEVFIQVTKSHHNDPEFPFLLEKEDDKNKFSDEKPSSEMEEVVLEMEDPPNTKKSVNYSSKRTSNSVKALLRKNFRVQMKQKGIFFFF